MNKRTQFGALVGGGFALLSALGCTSAQVTPNLDPRVFVVGDSTASDYASDVKPRMGWGQVFFNELEPERPITVVNLALSGRSSRSFIAEGWFDGLTKKIGFGDFLLIQFGHNDEKCGNLPPHPSPARDLSDIAKLCTYPGFNAAIPEGMSFSRTLEKYVALARETGAQPVLITPVTRRNFINGQIAASTHTTQHGAFPGDYAQTVRDTAKRLAVPLVDLDMLSMRYFNRMGEAASLDYFLAVDATTYPHYRKKLGSLEQPDNTHFQERGARALAQIIAHALQLQNHPLAQYLRRRNGIFYEISP